MPALTTIVAFCWMLSSILALILLIDRITSLYITISMSSIGHQGRQVIGTMYTWQGSDTERPVRAPNIPPWQGLPVTQTILYHGGPLSVVAFDLVGLVRLAHHADGIIEMTYAVGDTVVDGAPLANVRGGSHRVMESQIKRAVILRTERTIVQDPKYALRLLVDVAIRGLSPAVNDPTTAVMLSTRSRICCAAWGEPTWTWATRLTARARCGWSIPHPVGKISSSWHCWRS